MEMTMMEREEGEEETMSDELQALVVEDRPAWPSLNGGGGGGGSRGRKTAAAA